MSFGGQIVLVAGGGGGGGAAHQAAPAGFGGAAGFSGVGAGTVALGATGTNGVDSGATTTAGQGGQAAGGGAGGINSTDAADDGAAGGGAATGNGGNGGPDPDYDSAGGGGAGYTGGGGGASTYSTSVTGSGGGGGSSWVASASPVGAATTPTAVSGSTGTAAPAAAGAGSAGSVTIDWIPCTYGLSITKTAAPSTVNAGAATTWTVVVTNTGSDAMTKGDTVTLTDTLPAGPNGSPAPAYKVLSVATAGGSNAELSRGAVSCTGVTVGAAMPGSTVCSRPYAAPSAAGAPSGGTRGLDPGESLTITYQQITANTAPCATITNTATVVDRATTTGTTDVTGVTATRTVSTPLVINCYDLGVTVAAAPNSAPAGAGFTWTVTVINNGPGPMDGQADTSSNPLVVTDAAPVASASAPAGFTSTGPANGGSTCTYASGTITCPAGLAAGASQVFTFTQTVNNGVAPGTTITNTATVTDAKTGDTNDSANDVVTVALPGAPVANDDTGTTASGVALTVAASGLLANDTGTSITATGHTTPSHGTVTVNANGSYVYTPVAGYSGPDSFDYTITDSFSRTSTATVHLTVTPTAVADTATTPLNTPVSINVVANDHGTGLTVQSVTQPPAAEGTVAIVSGQPVFTPATGFTGTSTFSYTVVDGSAQTSTASVPVTVPLPAAPVATDDTGTTPAGTPLTVSPTGVLANDTGTLITVTAHTAPAHGTVTINANGSYVYTPSSGYSGPDAFTYTVTDGAGQTATATVVLTVTPLAVNDAVTTPYATPVTIDVVSNDHGQALSLTSVAQPAAGTGSVTITGGQAVYTPPTGFSGTTTFSYVVTDAAGRTSTAVVTVTVPAPSAWPRLTTQAPHPRAPRSPWPDQACSATTPAPASP